MLHETELELIAERYRELRHQAAVERQWHTPTAGAPARPGLLTRLYALLRPVTFDRSDDRAGARGSQHVLAS